MAQVSYGTITITDTNDIERIYVEYCRSTSNQLSGTTVPNITREWGETTPEWVDKQYIWQRSVVEESGTHQKTYGTPVCISGEKGETGGQGPQGPQGGTGAAGRSLTSTTTQYTTAATSATITQSNMGSYTWSSNVPAYNANTPAYWVRITNVYSNPSSTEYIIYKDNGITDAVKTSHDANTTAETANSTANTANQTANTANSTANSANTKADQAVTNVNNLQNKLKYYWVNEVAHTNGVSGWTKPNYPAGTYAASGISGTTFDAENSSTYGYNTWYANGINLRYNAIKLGELTGSALTFYQPSITSQGAKAMELSGTALKFYASNGTTVQAEFGGSKARVSGTINAYDGQIGNSEDNYWYIGNYLDYFENQSAIIKSHGTASIQLGDSNTWRIATNRIHTAWNNDSSSGDAFKLHFPVYDNKYWDSGLHLPTSANDKLLYIRNSSSSNTLTYLNEALEDQYTNRWNYLFYITNSGSIYAKNIYVLDDNGQATQIGGTDGVYLLKSGGTITGDLTVNGTITGTLSGTATRVSKDLKIQLNGGTTEGSNQFTYNGSTAKTINITKSSVGLSNVENTALSTWAGSANLTTAKVGTLAAAAVKGVDTSITSTSTSTNLPTSAAVATLVRGYLPLTGGNVTGAVTFGSSVSADELTVGDLVVNGAASFTNNLQANTINGVSVGASPKFTDTTYTFTGGTNKFTVKPSNATAFDVTVTPSIANNVTGSGTSGYLAKFTGANTIGNGPALSSTGTRYLKEDGTWATPAGTGVTSVTASGSGGITISGSPITTSGTIAIGLNLSTAINGLGEGTSPATRDDYIVAQYAGGGTTTTTYHRRKLSNIFAALNSSDITTALGYTPYNSTNPNGYTSNTGTVTSVRVQATSPVTSSVNTAQSTTLNTTIALADGYGDTKNPYGTKTANYVLVGPTSGNAAVPSFRKLVAADIPSLSWSKITSGTPTTSSGYGITDAIVDIGSNDAGQLVLTFSNNTTDTRTVSITATSQSSVAKAEALNTGGLKVGDTNKPVYFGTDGKPVAISYAINKTVPSDAKFTDTWNAMTGATSSANGTVGYINATPPKDGYNTKFWRADGSWAIPSSAGSADKATNDSDGNPISTTYLKKTTYEYSKELSFGSSGKLLIGKFQCYDSNVTIHIQSTTSITYNATAILATQNINTTGGGSFTWEVYGDANNQVTPNLYAKYASGSDFIEIYFSPSSWSKNLIHIQCLGLRSAPTNLCESVTAIPETANRQPTNMMVTKTGIGASGTWGINISGNAATATKLSNTPNNTTTFLRGDNTWTNSLANYVFNTTDMGEAAANLTGTTTAHVMTFYRNGIAIPYQMDNSNDGGLLRVRGTSETTTILELATWDDYGTGETIQFNYYPTTSQITPTYSVSVPKANGTICLTDGTGASGTWGISISGNAATATKATQDGDGNTITSSYLRRFPWWNNGDTHNIDDLRAGITFAYGGNHNGPTTGTVVAFDCSTSTSYTLQLMGSYGGDDLYFRNRNGDNNTWRNWNKTIHSNNYTDYTVTKTGTGASGTWGISITGNAATATTADKLTGFSSRSTSYSWGNQTGTGLTRMDTPAGGSIIFRDNNPASGQTSMLIDGTIYINEGNTNVGDAIKSITRSGTTFTYTTLWGNTGTFTQQDSDTKNTAGSTNTDSALFLIGATSQAANPQTYSHDTVKINTTGQIISTGYEMTTSSSMSNAKCQMRYEDSLQAIVFSFT